MLNGRSKNVILFLFGALSRNAEGGLGLSPKNAINIPVLIGSTGKQLVTGARRYLVAKNINYETDTSHDDNNDHY